MNENIERLGVVENIEKIYEKVFKRKGMGKFMQLAWTNVKEEYPEEPHILEVCIRLMIEELIVYAISIKGKQGYEEISNLKCVTKTEIILKPYEEVKNCYKDYIKKLEEYFKDNPEEKANIFKIEN